MILAVSGALIIGGAVFYIVFTMLSASAQMAAEERLGLSLQDKKERKKYPFYIVLTSPLLREPYISMGSQLWSAPRLEKHKRKLVSAGFGQLITAEQFVAAKFFLTIFVGLLFLLI